MRKFSKPSKMTSPLPSHCLSLQRLLFSSAMTCSWEPYQRTKFWPPLNGPDLPCVSICVRLDGSWPQERWFSCSSLPSRQQPWKCVAVVKRQRNAYVSKILRIMRRPTVRMFCGKVQRFAGFKQQRRLSLMDSIARPLRLRAHNVEPWRQEVFAAARVFQTRRS